MELKQTKKLYTLVSINKQKTKWNSKEEKPIQVNILNEGKVLEKGKEDSAETIISKTIN